MIDGPQFMGIARAIACGVGDAATPQDIKDALNYGYVEVNGRIRYHAHSVSRTRRMGRLGSHSRDNVQSHVLRAPRMGQRSKEKRFMKVFIPFVINEFGEYNASAYVDKEMLETMKEDAISESLIRDLKNEASLFDGEETSHKIVMVTVDIDPPAPNAIEYVTGDYYGVGVYGANRDDS